MILPIALGLGSLLASAGIASRSSMPHRLGAMWNRRKGGKSAWPAAGVQVGGAAAGKEETMAPTASPPKFVPPPPSKRPLAQESGQLEVSNGMTVFRPAIVPIESASGRVVEFD